MNVQQKTNKRGFTIIEVVLVLAIAALIFLMVFIALPALQRSQRDTARKQDVGTVASAVTSYTSNNRGTFPTASQLSAYLQDNSKSDVSQNTDLSKLKVDATNPGSVTATSGVVEVVKAATCNGTTGAQEALGDGSAAQFVVVTYLETGGGSAFCQDS